MDTVGVHVPTSGAVFSLRVDDLTPNVGLVWYFFTQVFEHFRAFYLMVFQVNLLVYVVPLILSLR